MAHKINGALNVVGQILNLKPETLATDPTLGALGSAPRIWVNSTSGLMKFFNGTAITALGDNTGLVTDQELTDALVGYVQSTDLAGYALSTNVTTEIGTAVAGLASTQDVTDAVANLVSTTAMSNAIDNAIAGLDFQEDVAGLETDFVDQAGRYIYVDGSTFATGVVAAAGDIVTVDATGAILSVAYDVSVAGPGALVWNTKTVGWFRYDGSNWAKFGGLEGVTAGNGVQKSGDELSVKLDGVSLTVGANGLKVGDLSATYATVTALTAAIADFVTESEMTSAIGTAVSGLATAASVTAVGDKVDALTARIEASEFQFTPQAAGTVLTVEHNFGNKYPQVQVVDTDDTVIGVDEIKFVDVNTLTVTLAVAGQPKVIVQGLKAIA